ncbi:MAG: hypothetical protein WKF96_01225 [Solirubrobacteraceae bacterium]
MRPVRYGPHMWFAQSWAGDRYNPAEELEHEQLQALREERDTAHLPDVPAEERDRYRDALHEIAVSATVQRNPDGDDQAAVTMRMIARETLGMNP